ncbi:glycosyltransferase 87 family protein [Frigoribacterium sp. PvP032]|uniref:glycosyltransferase 87 family protein n=1 Tax=Frigoribacterium sp. PvP032 TaxID=2806589 RepID=UPI001AE4EC0C|nr:glycosyltransferase 87 family protein [Frigoribacterium sp. PvP032]MBP1189354.1 fumarate reductase subunit C [Frigoribacterium sp. PvP032]
MSSRAPWTTASSSRRAREGLGHLGRVWELFRQQPRAIWWTFAALHAAVFVALTPLMLRGGAEGDLPLYRTWATGALSEGRWPVMDFAWVYPAGALLPVVLPNVLGESLYQLVWLVLVTAANAASLWLLTDRGRRTVDAPAAWWWLLVLFLLSPVAFLRLEAFSAPAVVAALLLLATRPRVAGALLAAATWVKVWPAAVIAAVVVASRGRAAVVRACLWVTLVVVAVVAVGGGLSSVDSFVTMQSDRALQLEAPLATPWLWMAMLGLPGASVYENVGLATREVMGPGDTWAVHGSTQAMGVVMIALVGLLAVAAAGRARAGRSQAGRAGRSSPDDSGSGTSTGTGTGHESRLVLLGALTLTITLIVFNKVGSPQYVLWIAPVVAAGLWADAAAFRTPARIVAWAAGLTTLVFPVLYLPLIDLNPVAVAVLGARNVLLVALFGWCVLRLVEEAMAAWGRELPPRWWSRRVRSVPVAVLADATAASSAPSLPVVHSRGRRPSS